MRFLFLFFFLIAGISSLSISEQTEDVSNHLSLKEREKPVLYAFWDHFEFNGKLFQARQIVSTPQRFKEQQANQVDLGLAFFNCKLSRRYTLVTFSTPFSRLLKSTIQVNAP